MSFQPPEYEHRAYYVFLKRSGEIVHAHRLLTIAGDDSVAQRFSEGAMIAEASQHTGHQEADLDVLVETGPPRKDGWIAGVDVSAKRLILSQSPRPAQKK